MRLSPVSSTTVRPRSFPFEDDHLFRSDAFLLFRVPFNLSLLQVWRTMKSALGLCWTLSGIQINHIFSLPYITLLL
jgi:hypothetical protein